MYISYQKLTTFIENIDLFQKLKLISEEMSLNRDLYMYIR